MKREPPEISVPYPMARSVVSITPQLEVALRVPCPDARFAIERVPECFEMTTCHFDSCSIALDSSSGALESSSGHVELSSSDVELSSSDVELSSGHVESSSMALRLVLFALCDVHARYGDHDVGDSAVSIPTSSRDDASGEEHVRLAANVDPASRRRGQAVSLTSTDRKRAGCGASGAEHVWS
jgi:hypothetical protein